MAVTTWDTLRTLLDRVRAGDQRAATELVRRYEPAIRRAGRLRLRDRQIRRFAVAPEVQVNLRLPHTELVDRDLRPPTGEHGMDRELFLVGNWVLFGRCRAPCNTGHEFPLR